MKNCSVCGGPLGAVNKYGICALTPQCRSARTVVWNTANREQARANTERYRARHPERVYIFSARARARDKGVPFGLVPDDLLPIPSRCVCCGVEGRLEVDEVLPGLGYVPGNVGWLCRRCNLVKGNGTVAEHLQIVDYMERTCAS